jgi:hypothetical protein
MVIPDLPDEEHGPLNARQTGQYGQYRFVAFLPRFATRHQSLHERWHSCDDGGGRQGGSGGCWGAMALFDGSATLYDHHVFANVCLGDKIPYAAAFGNWFDNMKRSFSGLRNQCHKICAPTALSLFATSTTADDTQDHAESSNNIISIKNEALEQGKMS